MTDLEQRSGIHDTGIVNDPAGSGIAYFGADHAWDELDVAGKQTQSRVKEEYSRFYALLTALLYNQPNSTTRTLEETEKKILKAIEQDSAEYHGDVHAIFASAQEALPQPAAHPGTRAPSWENGIRGGADFGPMTGAASRT